MFIYKNVDEQICRLNKRLTYVAGSLLFAMLGLSGAHAQNSSSLDEIIVTATKRSASLQDVGVSVSALGTEQINRINPVDSTELFQSVPSLELRSNAGSTNANIFLRGVGSTGISFNLQSGVGSYADEVVLNSPVVNILQVYDLERVEVLRGPKILYTVETQLEAPLIIFLKNLRLAEIRMGMFRPQLGNTANLT